MLDDVEEIEDVLVFEGFHDLDLLVHHEEGVLVFLLDFFDGDEGVGGFVFAFVDVAEGAGAEFRREVDEDIVVEIEGLLVHFGIGVGDGIWL